MRGKAGMEIGAGAVKLDPKRRALGKGLESLLPARATLPIAQAAEAVETPVVVAAPLGKPLEIELSMIDTNPWQTRKVFDHEKLMELARSIEANGVVQPIVVRGLKDDRYQLITGERRWLASFEAGKTTIPAIVREVSDVQAMEMTIVENLQRTDLNPMEQARAYQRLSDDFRMSQADMAVRTGMPRATVANYIRLMRLPKGVQTAVESGALSFGHAKALLALEGDEMVVGASQKVIALGMNVRQTETMVQGLLNPELKQKEAKPVERIDPNVLAAQNQLRDALGLRVRIDDNKGRGKVIIEYSGVDEFQGLMGAMGLK